MDRNTYRRYCSKCVGQLRRYWSRGLWAARESTMSATAVVVLIPLAGLFDFSIVGALMQFLTALINFFVLGLINAFGLLFSGSIAAFLFPTNPESIPALQAMYDRVAAVSFGIIGGGTFTFFLYTQMFPETDEADPHRFISRLIQGCIFIFLGDEFLEFVIELTNAAGVFFYPPGYNFVFVGELLGIIAASGTTVFVAGLVVLLNGGVSLVAGLVFYGFLSLRMLLLYGFYVLLPLLYAIWIFDFGPLKPLNDMVGLLFKITAVLLVFGVMISAALGASAAVGGYSGASGVSDPTGLQFSAQNLDSVGGLTSTYHEAGGTVESGEFASAGTVQGDVGDGQTAMFKLLMFIGTAVLVCGSGFTTMILLLRGGSLRQQLRPGNPASRLSERLRFGSSRPAAGVVEGGDLAADDGLTDGSVGVSDQFSHIMAKATNGRFGSFLPGHGAAMDIEEYGLDESAFMPSTDSVHDIIGQDDVVEFADVDWDGVGDGLSLNSLQSWFSGPMGRFSRIAEGAFDPAKPGMLRQTLQEFRRNPFVSPNYKRVAADGRHGQELDPLEAKVNESVRPFRDGFREMYGPYHGLSEEHGEALQTGGPWGRQGTSVYGSNVWNRGPDIEAWQGELVDGVSEMLANPRQYGIDDWDDLHVVMQSAADIPMGKAGYADHRPADIEEAVNHLRAAGFSVEQASLRMHRFMQGSEYRPIGPYQPDEDVLEAVGAPLPDHLDTSDAMERICLDATGEGGLNNMGSHWRYVLPDGSTVHLKDMDRPKEIGGTMLSDALAERLGVNHPDHHVNPAEGTLRAEGVDTPGSLTADHPFQPPSYPKYPERAVDEEAFAESWSFATLGGVSDIHGGNLVATRDGEVVHVDNDKFGARTNTDAQFKQALATGEEVAQEIGLDVTKEDLQRTTERLAAQVDPNEVAEDVRREARETINDPKQAKTFFKDDETLSKRDEALKNASKYRSGVDKAASNVAENIAKVRRGEAGWDPHLEETKQAGAPDVESDSSMTESDAEKAVSESLDSRAGGTYGNDDGGATGSQPDSGASSAGETPPPPPPEALQEGSDASSQPAGDPSPPDPPAPPHEEMAGVGADAPVREDSSQGGWDPKFADKFERHPGWEERIDTSYRSSELSYSLVQDKTGLPIDDIGHAVEQRKAEQMMSEQEALRDVLNSYNR